MQLRVLTPERIEIDAPVVKVTAEGEEGAFCLLPRHLDCTTALAPGLLGYVDQHGGEHFLAVDRGTLVKCGAEVLVSTPRAVRGTELGELKRTVDETFAAEDERRRETQTALGKMQADFIRRFLELEEHG
jgi:F-type H+-transporting ATPase subunit epsilon